MQHQLSKRISKLSVLKVLANDIFYLFPSLSVTEHSLYCNFHTKEEYKEFYRLWQLFLHPRLQYHLSFQQKGLSFFVIQVFCNKIRAFWVFSKDFWCDFLKISNFSFSVSIFFCYVIFESQKRKKKKKVTWKYLMN